MYRSYMGNISENVCAVLVSAARDDQLKDYELQCRDRYRTLIFQELKVEGTAFLEENFAKIPLTRFENLWEVIGKRYGWWYIHDNLDFICKRLSYEFMCVHRASRVLKKCGQYQDLMLLNDGCLKAFTYTDRDFYGIYARDGSRDMFQQTEDVRNIFGREFEYTLVMDGDTEIEAGDVQRLLRIAASHSDRTILQPAREFKVTWRDTLYMHLEKVRQQMAAPYTSVFSAVFNQWGFFGKGLIHNKSYIKKIIGKPGNLLEYIPINVLSHDTYEAAILKPLYVSTVSLIEKPPYNYLSWNSRLRRWNLGDLILAMHFFCCVGGPIRLLQRCVQCSRYQRTRLRTPLTMDFRTLYLCSSSIRSMFVKPIWLTYVILHATLPEDVFKYPLLPFIVAIATVSILSKVASVLNRPKTILFLLPELLASIIQFTAEVLVGCVRLVRVLVSLLQERYEWIPQRVVEQEFTTSNICRILLQSCKHLWAYTILGALLTCVLIFTGFAELKLDMRVFLYFNIGTITLLPVFCFITSIRFGRMCGKKNCQVPSRNVYRTSVQELQGGNPQGKESAGVTLVSARVIGIEMEYPHNAMYRRASRLCQAWSFSEVDTSTSHKLTLYRPPTRTMSTRLSLPSPSAESGKENRDGSRNTLTASDQSAVVSYHRMKEYKQANNEQPLYNRLRGNELRITMEQVAPSSLGYVDSEQTSNVITAIHTTNTEPYLARQLKLPKYPNTNDLFYVPSSVDSETKRDLDTIWSEDASSISTPDDRVPAAVPDDRAHRSAVPADEPVQSKGERRGPDGAFAADYDDILNDLYGSDPLNSSLSSLDGSMFRPKYPTDEQASSQTSNETWTPTPSVTDSQATYYTDEGSQTVQGTYSTEVGSDEDNILPAITVSTKREALKPKGSHVFFTGFDSPKRRPLTIDTLSDGFSIASSGSHSDWDRINVETAQETAWSSESCATGTLDYESRWDDTVSLPGDFLSFIEYDGQSIGTDNLTESLYSPVSSIRDSTSPLSTVRRRCYSASIITSTSDRESIRSSLDDLDKNENFFKKLNPMFRFMVPSGPPWPRRRGKKVAFTKQKALKGDEGGRRSDEVGRRPNRVLNTRAPKGRLSGKVQKRGQIFNKMYLPPNRSPSLERQKVESFQII
jgi:hypothetical protein